MLRQSGSELEFNSLSLLWMWRELNSIFKTRQRASEKTSIYRISGIFRVCLIFTEFATSLKSPKIETAKNKLYFTSSLRVLEIAKIWLGENLTHLPSVIFAKISRREKFPIYGISRMAWGQIWEDHKIIIFSKFFKFKMCGYKLLHK